MQKSTPKSEQQMNGKKSVKNPTNKRPFIVHHFYKGVYPKV